MEKLIAAGDALAEIVTRNLTMRGRETLADIEAIQQWRQAKEQKRDEH